MQTYITVTSEGRINGIYKKPLDFTKTIEISEEVYNDLLADQMEYIYSNGNIHKESRHEQMQKEENLLLFRTWRAIHLGKYDLLGMWIFRGDIDPSTMQPYAPITDEERQWLVAVRNFPEQVTATTTESDYPTLPSRLR